jgi:hypothetical protein
MWHYRSQKPGEILTADLIKAFITHTQTSAGYFLSQVNFPTYQMKVSSFILGDRQKIDMKLSRSP